MGKNTCLPLLPLHSENVEETSETSHTGILHRVLGTAKKWWTLITLALIITLPLMTLYLVNNKGDPPETTTIRPEAAPTTPPVNNPTPQGYMPASKDRQGYEHSITLGKDYILYQNASMCGDLVLLKISIDTNKSATGLASGSNIRLQGYDNHNIHRNTTVKLQIDPHPHFEDPDLWIVYGQTEFSDGMPWTDATCVPKLGEVVHKTELGEAENRHSIFCVLEMKLCSFYDCTNQQLN